MNISFVILNDRSAAKGAEGPAVAFLLQGGMPNLFPSAKNYHLPSLPIHSLCIRLFILQVIYIVLFALCKSA